MGVMMRPREDREELTSTTRTSNETKEQKSVNTDNLIGNEII